MGMACDAEAVSANGSGNVQAIAQVGGGVVQVDGRGKGEQAAGSGGGFLNPEETAMILTSLSKCQFSDPRGVLPSITTASSVADNTGEKRSGSSSGESDGERHSDLEGFSDDEEAGHHASSSTSASNVNNNNNSRVHRVQQINFDGPVGSKLDFTDEAGFSHRFRNESNRVKSMVTKHISIDELRAHFDRPIIDVAKDFGICITLMKKICRRNGIKRWPHRQIRSLSKSIASMEAAMLSSHGSEREKYRDQIHNLKLKRESVIADPNKDNGSMFSGAVGVRPKTPMAPQQQQLQQHQRHHLAAVSSSAGSASLRPHHHVSSATPKLSPRPTGSSNPAVSGAVGGSIRTETATPASTTTTSTTPTGSHSKGGRWTSEEHAAFLEGIRLYGKDWRRVAQVVVSRSAVQTRTHAQKYLLKFAGRFPFETPEGMLPPASSAATQARRHARSPPTSRTEDVAMMSPTATVMTTPASDDSSSVASWNSDEPQQPQQQQQVAPLPTTQPARSEAMAMILNGSPALEPEREPEPPLEPSMLGNGRVSVGQQATTLAPRSFAPLASTSGMNTSAMSAPSASSAAFMP